MVMGRRKTERERPLFLLAGELPKSGDQHSPRCVLSHAVSGLLRGDRFPAGHRLAMCRRPVAAGIPGDAAA